MSAFGGKADMAYCTANVRFDPKRTSNGLPLRPIARQPSSADWGKRTHGRVRTPKALVTAKRSNKMRLRLICTAFTISLLPVAANAQITIDMGAIRCDQYLAMSPAQSRDFSAWMSGWFSYQTRREFVDIELHQKNIANLKAWCQYHPQEGVMAGLQRGIGPTQ